VPVAGANDPRWDLLDDPGEAPADEYDEEYEADDYGADDAEDEFPRPRPPAPRAAKGKGREAWRAYLEGLPAAELAAFVLQLADRYPEVGRDLADRAALAQGATGDLIRLARKDIARLTAQEAWVNAWTGEGSLPDYGRLKARFEQLLANGQADALLELGETLFAAGTEQVNSSHDEGETAGAIIGCLDVVFRAVHAAGRPDVDKLLYVLGLELRDEYDLCQGARVVWEKEWPPAVWSAVADELARWLREAPPPKSRDEDFTSSYRRDRLSNRLIDALDRAGRADEILPLCEAEARATGSYVRLVDRLIVARRFDDAKRWAAEGIEQTGSHWAGVAHQLRDRLRTLAQRAKDWTTVAALLAEEFFLHPSVEALEVLQKAADKAGCGSAVRAAALHFLETGVRPSIPATAVAQAGARRRGRARPTKTAAGSLPWPLPILFTASRANDNRPDPYGPRLHFDVLLDLAIKEKRPDDALHWYGRMTERRPGAPLGWYGADHVGGRVADAVADTHPDRALAIYRQIVEAHVDRTSPSAYQEALPYVRKVRKLYEKLGRGADWNEYLAGLRGEHRRKRKFMELLDRLDGKRIVDG
jgi:uncharacterized Zn finger protein